MNNTLTSGSVLNAILRFSPPFFLSYFLQTLYGMADLFIIGKFNGVADTTAVSIGSMAMHMLTVILVGLSMGSTITIGKAAGAGDRREAAKATGNTLTLFMILSVILVVLLFLLIHPIVQVMKTPQEAVSGTIEYLKISFIGIPAITAYNIISSIFRGLGDSRRPMYFIAVACAANIGLDCLFIGPMHMGPGGAALGTVCAQLLSVLLAAFVMVRRDIGIHLKKTDLIPSKRVSLEIFRVGLPVAVQDGLIQVSFMVIAIIANMRGVNDAAAVGIVEKVISFIFLVPSSMLATVSALGALNIGAGKPERTRQTLWYAMVCCIAFGIFMAVLMQFEADLVTSLFNKDETVIRLGGQYMRGYIIDCSFAGIHFCFSGYFCAHGRSIYSFIHNFISISCARIPLAYLASKTFPDTLFPMGLATTTGSVVSVIICVILYRRLNAALSKNRTV